MCNNFSRRGTFRDYVNRFRETGIKIVSPRDHEAPNLPMQDDIRPTDQCQIFRGGEDGVEMIAARWWLVPWFHKGALKDWKAATFNARSEGIRETKSFREAFQRRRCLIPADSWFEFSGTKGNMQRWEIAPRDGEWFCIAGVWDRAETTDGVIDSFAMVMQPSHAALSAINDRAPIVLPREHWATWLDLSADIDFLMGPESPDRFDIRPALGRSKAAQGALF